MKHYLFRGKRMDNKEWIYGSLIQDAYGTFIHIDSSVTTENGCEPAVADIEVILQTVGRGIGTDIENRTIFEDDVVMEYFEDVEMHTKVVKSEVDLLKIKTHYGNHNEQDTTGRASYKVVDNIHDNPHLIPEEIKVKSESEKERERRYEAIKNELGDSLIEHADIDIDSLLDVIENADNPKRGNGYSLISRGIKGEIK